MAFEKIQPPAWDSSMGLKDAPAIARVNVTLTPDNEFEVSVKHYDTVRYAEHFAGLECKASERTKKWDLVSYRYFEDKPIQAHGFSYTGFKPWTQGPLTIDTWVMAEQADEAVSAIKIAIIDTMDDQIKLWQDRTRQASRVAARDLSPTSDSDQQLEP